jgi:hypothetical protein
LAEKLDRKLLGTYVSAVEDCGADAVALVCKRISSGQAGLNSSFPPTPADIAERAALLDAGSKPQPLLHNGIIEMDFGHGRVDMRGLKTEEQDEIIRLNGKTPDGRNFALLSLAEKRAALDPKALPAPNRVPVPCIQRMNK